MKDRLVSIGNTLLDIGGLLCMIPFFLAALALQPVFFITEKRWIKKK